MKIRVLHLISSLQRGGIEIWLLSMLKEIPRTDCEMDFCCKGSTVGDLAPVVEKLGARVYYCKLRVSHTGFLSGLRRILKEGQYDIVHSHMHSYSGLPVLVSRRLGLPVITSFHNTKFLPTTWIRFPVLRQLRSVYSKMSVAYALAHSQMLTGCSQAVFDSHLSGEWRMLAKSRVLYYGVAITDLPSNRQRAEFRESFGWETDSPILIHVGSFTEQKNHLGVLSIFERVVDKIQSAKLLLVGDGPMRSKVEKRIEDRCLVHCVCLLGLRDDVPQLMALSDVLLFPSLHEGFGIVGLEANAVGTPVVGSRVGGIVEAVVDGQTGILHDVNDIEGMAESVCRILDDPDYRRQLGQAGRQRVQKQFSLEAAAHNLLRLYHDCLSKS